MLHGYNQAARCAITLRLRGNPMNRRLLSTLMFVAAAGLSAPRAGLAQTFKVDKFDIKGEGGTDYVAVEAGDRPRVRLALHAHDGGRRRHRQGARRHPEHAGRARRRHRHQGRSRLHDQRRRPDRHDVRPEDAGGDQADQGRPRPRRHHVRRARRQDHPDQSQPPDRHAHRDRSQDRRHRRHGRARGQRARRGRGRRQGAHLRQQRRARTRSR